jgi:hypothetical protein
MLELSVYKFPRIVINQILHQYPNHSLLVVLKFFFAKFITIFLIDLVAPFAFLLDNKQELFREWYFQ